MHNILTVIWPTLFTCELLFAAISHTGFQVLQLYLDLLVVSKGLFTLSPNRHQEKKTETEAQRQ